MSESSEDFKHHKVLQTREKHIQYILDRSRVWISTTESLIDVYKELSLAESRQAAVYSKLAGVLKPSHDDIGTMRVALASYADLSTNVAKHITTSQSFIATKTLVKLQELHAHVVQMAKKLENDFRRLQANVNDAKKHLAETERKLKECCRTAESNLEAHTAIKEDPWLVQQQLNNDFKAVSEKEAGLVNGMKLLVAEVSKVDANLTNTLRDTLTDFFEQKNAVGSNRRD
eukprot:Rmarinus@m.8379